MHFATWSSRAGERAGRARQAIPQLQREYGDDFWPAFAGQADVIEDDAGPECE